MKKIIVIGSANTDMVISGAKIPEIGETVSGGAFAMNAGGKGANQAVAVARLASKDLSCVFIGKVGNDVFGRDTALRMKDDGIKANLLVDKKVASGTALILVDEKGRNCISVALGANATLTEKEVLPLLETPNVAVVLCQLETPVRVVAQALKTAKKRGACTILNPAPARELPPAIYKVIDWITPNETEAELLSGVKVIDVKSAQHASSILLRRGVKHVIITLGSNGCYLSDTNKIYPCKRVKTVDTVAAGDTFNGAFAVALAEGKTPEDAIKFAQAASAIAVTRHGAQPSVPFRREVKL